MNDSIYSTPALFNDNYLMATVRDFSMRLLAIPSMVFLVLVARRNRKVYEHYKASIYLVWFTYWSLAGIVQLQDLNIFIRIIFHWNETTALGCALMKVIPPFGAWSFEGLLLGISVARLFLIAYNVRQTAIITAVVSFLTAFPILFYPFAIIFIPHPNTNDACSPTMTTKFAGGFKTISVYLWMLTLCTCFVNFLILVRLGPHFKHLQEVTTSAHMVQNQRNVTIGIIAQSIFPLFSNGLTLWHSYALSIGLSPPLYVTNVVTFLARFQAALRAPLAFVFLHPFREEMKDLAREYCGLKGAERQRNESKITAWMTK